MAPARRVSDEIVNAILGIDETYGETNQQVQPEQTPTHNHESQGSLQPSLTDAAVQPSTSSHAALSPRISLAQALSELHSTADNVTTLGASASSSTQATAPGHDEQTEFEGLGEVEAQNYNQICALRRVQRGRRRRREEHAREVAGMPDVHDEVPNESVTLDQMDEVEEAEIMDWFGSNGSDARASWGSL